MQHGRNVGQQIFTRVLLRGAGMWNFPGFLGHIIYNDLKMNDNQKMTNTGRVGQVQASLSISLCLAGARNMLTRFYQRPSRSALSQQRFDSMRQTRWQLQWCGCNARCAFFFGLRFQDGAFLPRPLQEKNLLKATIRLLGDPPRIPFCHCRGKLAEKVDFDGCCMLFA